MKVSIITPVYNAENSIENTILSIIKQKKYIYEYIIVDGGSKDNTLDIISKYQDDIDVLVVEEDEGIADAYNKGIKIATGDLIGIVAADDQLISNAIGEVSKEYDGYSDVLSGNIIDFNGARYRRRISDPVLTKLYKGTSLMHPATFVRKDAYLKFGFYSLDYRCAIDRELFLRFYESGAKFQISDIDISLFSSGNGISTINPTKVAFPEDYLINRKYGMPELRAILFLNYSKLRYYIYYVFKRIFKITGVDKRFNQQMVKKGKFISESEVKKLDIF